jgi:hypothetical protein
MIGLGPGEVLPIRRATEDNFEAYGWNELQSFDAGDNTVEIEPHAQVMRSHSDPTKPLSEDLINEMRTGGARAYVVGEQRWTVAGEMHGCEFCAWTSGDGRAILCRKHNRCF